MAETIVSCPHLTVLVTSREPLHIDGEWEFAVDPLREREAVALFLQRATAVRSDFTANGEVAEICRRLDCLPLAIELAAARVKVLALPALLQRLEQRLPLLAGGSRSAPERQRTLRATIAWSYELLTPEEQATFAKLAVFAGGCTLEAAEEICGADVDAIASLVDKSLIRHSGDRYWMLQTIREYARELLEESGEADAVRGRHAEHYLALAELAYTERFDAESAAPRAGERQPACCARPSSGPGPLPISPARRRTRRVLGRDVAVCRRCATARRRARIRPRRRAAHGTGAGVPR